MNPRPTATVAPHSCVLVADQKGARLLAATRRDGRLYLEQLAEHPNDLKPHDRGGPAEGTGARRITFTDPDRDHDIMRDQFAKDLVVWLHQELKARQVEGHLTLFAPPEFLGAIRGALSSRPLDFDIREHAAELSNLKITELERHPTVIEELDHLK